MMEQGNNNNHNDGHNRLIVCLTGMPGAGKSTVAEFLKSMGFSMITMGDAVRAEAKRQGLDATDTNLGKLMVNLRKDLGPGAVAHLIIRKIESDGGYRESAGLVVDGIRSISEVRVLTTMGHVKLLAIHASPETRLHHLWERKRSDAPANAEEFVGRDQRELSVGISEAIALADETISNNNLTLAQLKEKAYCIVEKWLKEVDGKKS